MRKQAETALWRILNKMMNTQSNQSPQAKFDEALALQQSGDFRAAIERFELLLAQLPDNADIMNLCAICYFQMNNIGRALEMLERAVVTRPDHDDAWNNLGQLRQELDDHIGASEAYHKVCQLVPDSPHGFINFGNMCQFLERFEEGALSYERALSLEPGQPEVWANYARTLLYAGDWEKANQATVKTISLAPGHAGALALQSIALQELGRMDEWSALVDFDRLIQGQEIALPAGYSDMTAFNKALCDHCINHPSLEYEPADNTTTKGHQTGNLAKADEPGPIGALIDAINTAVGTYRERHPIDPAHPYLAQRPKQWDFDIWGTVLSSQGHQASHIHRSAWLSGVYYAGLPDVISGDDTDHIGWIEFGHPQSYPETKSEPVVKHYPPKEGTMFLFPSYLYHRTVPFESSDRRVSIAFDLLAKA